MDGKKILINYKGANIESVSAGPRDLIRLNPGVNTVDADKWDRIIKAAKEEAKNKKSKTKGGILFLMENDLVSVVPAKGSKDGAETTALANITELSVKDGTSIVSACADISDLNAYLADERGSQNRAKLVKAIENQIEALETAAHEAAATRED